jgi:hypothetical protein
MARKRRSAARDGDLDACFVVVGMISEHVGSVSAMWLVQSVPERLARVSVAMRTTNRHRSTGAGDLRAVREALESYFAGTSSRYKTQSLSGVSGVRTVPSARRGSDEPLRCALVNRGRRRLHVTEALAPSRSRS